MKTQLERTEKSMKLKLNKRTVFKLTGGLKKPENGFIYTITETGNSTIGICTVADTYQTSRTTTRTGN